MVDTQHTDDCTEGLCFCDPLHKYVREDGKIVAYQQHDTFIIGDNDLKDRVRELCVAAIRPKIAGD